VYQPWRRKAFLLSEIKQVVLTSSHNSDNSIRIVMNNFVVKEYVCIGMRDADWIELINLCKSYQFPLTDENNFVLMVTPEMKRFNRRLVWLLTIYIIVALVLYMIVVDMQVPDTVMVLLKIGWLVFLVAGLIGVFILAMKLSAGDKEQSGNEPDSIKPENKETENE
jgi:hypothetical protein